jgi:hypothetical protein
MRSLNVFVKRSFGNAHHPANLTDRVLFLIVEFSSQCPFFQIQSFWSAAISPARSCSLKSDVGPFPDKIALEFGQGPKI